MIHSNKKITKLKFENNSDAQTYQRKCNFNFKKCEILEPVHI